MRSRHPKILIAGAGIGGLALALALQRKQMAAVVWERASEIREIGAGLLLTPNAVWVLERLGLSEDTCKAGRTVRQWQILSRRGRVLQTFEQEGGDLPSISITRSAFQQLLLGKVPRENVLLDREVVSFTQEPGDDFASILSASGQREEADLIVGADGGRSIIRKSLGASAPRVLRYIGWRGLVDRAPTGWERGRITESWGDGGRFGIAPVADGRTYWYATENLAPGRCVPPVERKAHLLSRFREWHEPIPDLIAATSEEAILRNEISEQTALSSWGRGCVTLLGDAAHLMTPNLGQGAAMAMEDAWVLAGCLETAACVSDAIARYERLRKPRASNIVWQSRQVGRLIQLQNPVLAALRDLGLRLLPDWIGTRATKPVFGFRA
jgi:2-polyprenyl-6-methoxyphenol hydroxylase-like FAD-dependent oxidoreductase